MIASAFSSADLVSLSSTRQLSRAFRYPMVLYGTTETLVPYLYISAPLFAIGYLVWYWLRGRQPLTSIADQTV